jgi:hypothetical protein
MKDGGTTVEPQQVPRHEINWCGTIPQMSGGGQMQRRLYGRVHTIVASTSLEKCRLAALMNREGRHM